jgi:hypothetical protein
MNSYNTLEADLVKTATPESDVYINEAGMLPIDVNSINPISVKVIMTVVTSTADSINSIFSELTIRETSIADAQTNSTLSDTPEEESNVVENETLLMDKTMTRDAIVDLRIRLNEGTKESDFSLQFPYERI